MVGALTDQPGTAIAEAAVGDENVLKLDLNLEAMGHSPHVDHVWVPCFLSDDPSGDASSITLRNEV